MTRITFNLLSLLLAAGPAALAQESNLRPPAESLVVREGTELKLKFAEDVSSKTAVVDDPVTLVVDEDIKVGETVVVRAGAKAYAVVTNAKKAGMMGKGGELNIRLDYLRTDVGKMKLRGTKSRQGEDNTTSAIVLTVLLGPVGLIKHGKEVDVRAGSPLTAYVAEDTVLAAPAK